MLLPSSVNHTGRVTGYMKGPTYRVVEMAIIYWNPAKRWNFQGLGLPTRILKSNRYMPIFQKGKNIIGNKYSMLSGLFYITDEDWISLKILIKCDWNHYYNTTDRGLTKGYPLCTMGYYHKAPLINFKIQHKIPTGLSLQWERKYVYYRHAKSYTLNPLF